MVELTAQLEQVTDVRFVHTTSLIDDFAFSSSNIYRVR